MAVTITRSPWIDDDGTGTTGTVINNAVKTDLYNQIDAALAKVPQLAGGNAFTGNQSITGTLSVASNGTFTAANPGGSVIVGVQNTAAGAAAQTRVTIGNDSDVALMTIMSLSSTFVAAGYNQPNGSVFYQGGSGGLSFLAAHGAGAIRFYSGGAAERMRITPTGELLIGTQTLVPGFAQKVGLVFDGGVGSAYVIQNVAGSNTGNINVFQNAAGGTAGYINQTGALAVNYSTASDRRLKTDLGRATDLAALRAVVIHDFTWTADGVRDRGVFAQDAQALYPRAVTEGTDETTADGGLVHPWATDYSKFVPDLIVGWQQHEAALAEFARVLVAMKGSPDAER